MTPESQKKKKFQEKMDVAKRLAEIRKQRQDLDQEIELLQKKDGMMQQKQKLEDEKNEFQQKVFEWDQKIAALDDDLVKINAILHPKTTIIIKPLPKDDENPQKREATPHPTSTKRARPNDAPVHHLVELKRKAEEAEALIPQQYVPADGNVCHCRNPQDINYGYRMVFRLFRETAMIQPKSLDEFVVGQDTFKTWEEASERAHTLMLVEEFRKDFRKDQELIDKAAMLRRYQFNAEIAHAQTIKIK